jgi:hypothetical protein
VKQGKKTSRLQTQEDAPCSSLVDPLLLLSMKYSRMAGKSEFVFKEAADVGYDL